MQALPHHRDAILSDRPAPHPNSDASPASLLALSRFLPPKLSLPKLLLILAIIGYACAFSYLTVVRYAAFESRALDMGNLNQAIWNTAHGNWFHLTNQPGTVNRLSLHVEPILIPISWLYLLYPAPPLLLVLQAVVVALGALPLFALARHQLRHEWIALAFALIYLLNPTMQAANWLEFHPITLAPTFLLAAFYYLIKDRPGRFALFAVLAASCKEEMALIIFMLGAYAFLIRRRPRWGLVTMALSMAWALLAVLGLQQLFADGNIHWNRYAYLGDSPVQMVLSLLTRPGVVWAQLVSADAGGYLWSLLWPTGLIALLAPEVLLLALPSLAINLLADFPPMHETHTLIYAAPIAPLVLAAAVMGVARLQTWVVKSSPRVGQGLMMLLAVIFLALGIADQRLYGYLPGSGNAMPLTVTPHHTRAAALIAQIPADAAVSAQDRLNPHVSGRETLYIFPRVTDERLGDADTVFVDVTGPAWPQHPNDLRASIYALLDQGFGVAAAEDGYLLLRRGVANRTLPDTFYSAWHVPDVDPTQSLGLRFGDVLELLDFRMVTDRYGELVAEITWLPLRELDQELRFYVAYVAADGTVLYDNDFYQPASVLWYPTTLWGAATPVRVTTLPWSLDADQFVPLLGVYTGRNWAEGEQLSITLADELSDAAPTSPFPLLQGGKVVRLGGYQRAGAGIWHPVTNVSATPTTPLDVNFGGMIDLVGADLPAQAVTGLELPFTLHWQASAPVNFDYTAFAHLLDDQGNKVAQLDWQPHDSLGVLPTSAWPLGWPVMDAQQLPLPPDLPAGEYRLLVGFYNWQSGDRLPVQGTDVIGGDVVEFGPLQIAIAE